MMGLVSANGRVFAVADEGSIAYPNNPANWSLCARDAYNGVLLWRIPIQRYQDHMWRLKNGPAQLPRRLVAEADRVYVTLDINGPVSALDAASGKIAWSFLTGARIDSPPTIYKGRAYFGCADGWVYCLNAADGALVWKFLAAGHDKQLFSHGQLESVHPVHGMCSSRTTLFIAWPADPCSWMAESVSTGSTRSPERNYRFRC
jgi:outer membrane protein assembly factor BamB